MRRCNTGHSDLRRVNVQHTYLRAYSSILGVLVETANVDPMLYPVFYLHRLPCSLQRLHGRSAAAFLSIPVGISFGQRWSEHGAGTKI